MALYPKSFPRLPARLTRRAGLQLLTGALLVPWMCGARAGGPTATVSVTVNRRIRGNEIGVGFAGLSYEKSHLSTGFFTGANTPLVTLCHRLGPSLLRIGGNSVDRTSWNADGPGQTGGQTAPADIDALAAFLRAANWTVLYGLNFATNTNAQLAAEAAYAAETLGHQLYGFEIGNEPDLYASNGDRPPTFTYAEFLSEWTAYANALTAQVPDAILTGPASASNVTGWTAPFAADETSRISLLTQHYYRANGESPSSTLALLLAGDPALPALLQKLHAAAHANLIPSGYRLAEANSFYNGGAPNISDANGTALWVIDFLFINALYGSAGVNFHGGGSGPGYTPIADDGAAVVDVRPEYYGMLLFALAARGTLVSTLVQASGLELSAYAVTSDLDWVMRVVVVNKDPTTTANTVIEIGDTAALATVTVLTAPALDGTTGMTLDGASIGSDGSWEPNPPARVPVTAGRLALAVGPGSAALCTFQLDYLSRRPE